MTGSPDTAVRHLPWLRYFPVSSFAIVMGLAGLAIAWTKAHTVLALTFGPGRYLLWLAAGVLAFLLLLYAAKLALHGSDVLAELRHPIMLNFFPAISIGFILLGAGLADEASDASRLLWGAGAALHLVFTLFVMSSWINHTRYEIAHINPTWFIPVVGNILVPIAGVRHGMMELSWFYFSIGIVFWVVLATIIFYRMIFHDPLPARLVPTMFILIAPPAVGFVSYVALIGSVDAFAKVLYYIALFLTLMLLTQANRFYRVPFSLSWWAYSFPMAAITIATLVMYESTTLVFFRPLAIALLILLSILLAMLVFRTGLGALRGEICVPD